MKTLKRNILVLLSVSMVLTSVSLVGNYRYVSSKNKPEVRLLKGEWSFAAHPYVGPGYKLRPAIVSATAFNPKDGIRKVVITNNSDKPIISMKLSWRLFTKQRPNDVLQNGESAFIKFDEKLQPKEQKSFDCSINSYREFLESLKKNGQLKGDLRIDVAVSEVHYVDNSSWKGEEITKTQYVGDDSTTASTPINNKKAQFVKISSQTKMTSGVGCSNTPDGCHNECVFVGVNENGCPLYECQPTTDPIYCVNTTFDPICPGETDCTTWLC